MMEALRNNKETLAVVAVGAVVVSSAALLGLVLSKRNQRATRRATLQCHCGKVKAEIHQPAANYKYAETQNIQCGCNDCMGYCKAVLKEGSTEDAFQESFFNPGVPTILFYSSEIKLVSGKELLAHMKISPKTENRRVFTTCCGTPLSISPDGSPLNLVYCPTISPLTDCGENEVPFPREVLDKPTLCFHGRKFLEDPASQVKAKQPQMTVIAEHNAPKFVLGMIGRLLLLVGLGAKGPGEGFPVEDGKTVGIGYEAITKSMRK
ncbi:expressed unknown protein [Seminavis robusta]|uniref:Uncharacterized protein n=1 Tax=Seminavis robusta TaxID=568900 RepID=A0A9N8HPP0_9STRA|nr:expressed unknown protein [Seminavis robusta]|eukprot:Sro1087_g239900.1 n/a (264) ;mRNA; r:34730-35623